MSDYSINLAFPPQQLDTRCQLMIEVTFETLCSDPQLRLCEGLRLIEAARSSVARLSPGSLGMLEDQLVPAMRQVLLQRFGVADPVPMLEIN